MSEIFCIINGPIDAYAAIAQFLVNQLKHIYMAIEKQLLYGFAAAIGVKRPPVESLWSLYHHVRLITDNYL